jgi:hypothetical protein
MDGKDIPCLVHVYKSEHEDLWWTTTDVLSFIASEGSHDNILPYMWSAKGKCEEFSEKNKTSHSWKYTSCIIHVIPCRILSIVVFRRV